MKRITVLIVLGFALAFSACKKKPDQPPIKEALGLKFYSVAELKTLAACTGTCSKRFTTDVHFIGVVIADESSGNFYKELYVRDRYNTGAIHLDLTKSSSFFVGDSVRLSLKGYDVGFNPDTDMLEIDSIDFEKHITRFASGANPEPILLDLSVHTYTNYLCDLVKINYAGFIPADTNKVYADVPAQMSLNRTIQDCAGNQIIVRTSNYANFASQKTPKGWGQITGIATAYNGDQQMALRRASEVNMTGAPCALYLKKDWEDNSLTSGGWSQQSVINGAVQWTSSTFGGAYFARISGYISGNQNSENWLISPAVDLSGASNPILSFRTAAKFSGDLLQVLVSTNYSGGAPGSATWVLLGGFNLSPNTGNYIWTPSGKVSLSSYKNANTRVAFKYTSTTSGATTYEVDDVVISEN
jgi:hypothetical protein